MHPVKGGGPAPESSTGRICTKFDTGTRLADEITSFEFFVDWLMGLGSARGRILPFSIYLESVVITLYRAPVINNSAAK